MRKGLGSTRGLLTNLDFVTQNEELICQEPFGDLTETETDLSNKSQAPSPHFLTFSSDVFYVPFLFSPSLVEAERISKDVLHFFPFLSSLSLCVFDSFSSIDSFIL